MWRVETRAVIFAGGHRRRARRSRPDDALHRVVLVPVGVVALLRAPGRFLRAWVVSSRSASSRSRRWRSGSSAMHGAPARWLETARRRTSPSASRCGAHRSPQSLVAAGAHPGTPRIAITRRLHAARRGGDRHRRTSAAYQRCGAVHGAYLDLAALLTIVATTAIDRIDDRLLAPIYVVVMAGGWMLVDRVVGRLGASRRTIARAVVACWMLYPMVHVTVDVAQRSRSALAATTAMRGNAPMRGVDSRASSPRARREQRCRPLYLLTGVEAGRSRRRRPR